MPAADRPIGLKAESVNHALAQISSWKNPYRTLVADDASVAAVPVNTYLPGDNCRAAVDQEVRLFVAGAAAGVVVELYAVETVGAASFIFLASLTTTVANQELKFQNVIGGFKIAVKVTGVGAGVTLAGGITR